MAKVIEVIFYKQLGTEELYTSSNGKIAYVRQPMQDTDRVIWSTAKKSADTYEAEVPIKAGVTIKVVNGNKRKDKVVHYEELMITDESGTVSAEKKEHFVSTQLANAATEYVKKMSLHTRDSWIKWLQADASKYDYSGYSDNWLHFGTRVLETQTIGTLAIFSRPFYVEETKWKHMICGKVWSMVEIKDPEGNVVKLCGVAY